MATSPSAVSSRHSRQRFPDINGTSWTQTIRKHRLGRRRRLDDPRLPQLRHPARHHLQRLSAAGREDRPDRHGQGAICRRVAAEHCFADRSFARGLRGLQPRRAGPLPARCRRRFAPCPRPPCCAIRNVRPRSANTSISHPGRFAPSPSGETISLGRRTLQFIETPMVHWPESMFTYVPEDKLLFSMDAFGQHCATSERFDDQSDPAAVMQEAKTYYANIVMPYGKAVLGVPGTNRQHRDWDDRAQPRTDLAQPRRGDRRGVSPLGAPPAQGEGAGDLRHDVGEHRRDGPGDLGGRHTAGRQLPS